MAVPFSNTKLRVPKGFQNVLEGLAREVLRCQPDNIYSFAASYFEELLRKRQETGYDDITLLGAKLEDRFYNNHCFKNPNVNQNNDDQQSAAVVIQSEYRRFAAQKEVDSLKEEKAATVIQASFRGHAERNTVRMKETGEKMVDNTLQEEVIGSNQNNVGCNTEHELRDSNQNNFTEKYEADKIEVKATLDENNDNLFTEIDNEEILEKGDGDLIDSSKIETDSAEVIDIDLEDPDVEKAALKIQSVFKGFKGRRKKEIPIMKEPEENIQIPEEKEQVKNETEENPQIVEEKETVDDEVADKTKEGAIIDSNMSSNQEAEVIDIDLKDPEVEKAALKIQSVFKGFSGRKRVKSNNKVTTGSQDIQNAEVEQNLITEEIKEESNPEVPDDNKASEPQLEVELEEQAETDENGDVDPITSYDDTARSEEPDDRA